MHQISEGDSDLADAQILLKIVVMYFDKHYKVLVHY